MKVFECQVKHKGIKVFKIDESGGKDDLICSEVFPKYLKFVCRKCGGEMTIDITGMDYCEEYVLICEKCKIEIRLQAASG